MAMILHCHGFFYRDWGKLPDVVDLIDTIGARVPFLQSVASVRRHQKAE